MTNRLKWAFRVFTLLGVCCATSDAATILPGDDLTIQVYPAGGTVTASPDGYTGWGFTVTWISSNDHWIQFTGSTLGSVAPGGSESNSSLHQEPLIDFIGAQGGPDPLLFALAPGVWTEPFDYALSRGVGAFHMTTDPLAEKAEDHGQITLFFDVYDGPPAPGGENRISSLSYYGPDTQFSVMMMPEPGTFGLLLLAAAAGVAWRGARGALRRG
jgi:hypothetical protein